MTVQESEQTTAGQVPAPDLQVVEEMQRGIVGRFAAVQQAKAEGKPVVWASVLAPKEILEAMDVATVIGNVLGGYVSIFGLSAKYCQVAEEHGISRDVCAVNRCTVGLALSKSRDDFFNLAFAVPDLAVGSNYPCMSESKAFLAVVDRFKIPYYFLDAPLNTWGGDIPEHAVKYYARQLQGLIDFLEEHGYRLDMDRLKEQVAFTKALNVILDEIEGYKRAIPLPMKAYDCVIAATAPLALSKEFRNLEIFEKLRDELKQRVENRIGVVENERLRLLWIGVPPLCDFKLLNYPERHGAVVAKSMIEFLTGFSLDPHLMDPEKPLESIARAHLAGPLNPPYRSLVNYFLSVVKDYRIDGVISVVKRTCGMVPGMQRICKEAVYRETGVPSVVFDLDGIDSREYDAAATKASLDSFIEILLKKKGY